MENIIKTIDSYFVNGLFGSSLVLLIVLILLFCCNFILNRFIKKRWPNNLLVSKGIKRTIYTTIIVITILSQITIMSTIVTAIIASSGILAVMIGFASQEAAGNMISGMLIIAYRPFSLGDFVYLQEHNIRGKVFDITLRHTIIETLEKTHVIIPNIVMNSTYIENISNVPNNKANYLFMDISYDSDYDLACNIIREIALAHRLCIDQRTPEEISAGVEQIMIHCTALKDSSVEMRATIYTLDNATGFELLSDLRILVKKAFESKGIEIPYPHLVIQGEQSCKK